MKNRRWVMWQHTTELPVLPTFETITRPEVSATPLGAPELRVRDRGVSDRKEGQRMLRNKQNKKLQLSLTLLNLWQFPDWLGIFPDWTVMIKSDFHWHNAIWLDPSRASFLLSYKCTETHYIWYSFLLKEILLWCLEKRLFSTESDWMKIILANTGF